MQPVKCFHPAVMRAGVLLVIIALVVSSPASGQQPPEVTTATVVFYGASSGLFYDRCAQAGFAPQLNPSAEDRYEAKLSEKERLGSINNQSTEEAAATLKGARAGWDAAKRAVKALPATDLNERFCRSKIADFDKYRKWFGL